MSSSPRDHVTSSPIDGSTDHTRRSIGDTPDSPLRPRISPPLSRSYAGDDPDARERQRTMDVDMAMQLSRARRETFSASSFEASNQKLPQPSEQGLPITFSLSHSEQHALDIARGAHVDEGAYDSSLHPPRPSSPAPFLLRHLSPGHDSSFMVPPAETHADRDQQPTPAYPHTYQTSASRPKFDFAHMEEFAAVEKIQLGIVSTKISLGDAFEPSPPELFEPFSDAINRPFRPARHRKLSQSISSPRTHRKGIGGKMALFENRSERRPPSLPGLISLGLGSNPNAVQSSESLVTKGGNQFSASPTQAQGGRLSPPQGILHTGHDRPYRFSFYSNALSATIHARSLSELPAEGQSFEELFTGITAESVKNGKPGNKATSGDRISSPVPVPAAARTGSPGGHMLKGGFENSSSGRETPRTSYDNVPNWKYTKAVSEATHGDFEGNTWWLDVESPTDEEMKTLSKVFSIHPLTTEDIQMEETREKIEVFRNYYLVCFRSFDQDQYSPTHLEPLNMYIIVFREGTLSFHFRPTPHPQNVRRRIKQLKDYIDVTSDWISYAVIDDITDAFGPLIQNIEYEVDSIDELVLILRDTEQSDMLRRIGTCRKKVMGMLRLMGNKADVVKGLAKRCNENWKVVPNSDIGLYLSDIQDHLITMTQSLNHYEKILSRSHSNYLAQISIEMTDANNQINDVLSKLTALGTVLVPMNLVTGLWGMNVYVPGQEARNLKWFLSIIVFLAAFAIVCGYSTYRFLVRKRTTQ